MHERGNDDQLSDSERGKRSRDGFANSERRRESVKPASAGNAAARNDSEPLFAETIARDQRNAE